jgi:hypothetical protein
MFILVNDMSSKGQPDYTWYVCDLGLYENPNSSWLLQATESLHKKDAMEFCEVKAKQIAEILTAQVDEEGYNSLWVVEEVEAPIQGNVPPDANLLD